MEQSKTAFNLSIVNIFVLIFGFLTGMPILIVASLALSGYSLGKVSKLKKQGLSLDSKAKTAKTISYVTLILALLFAILIYVIPSILM